MSDYSDNARVLFFIDYVLVEMGMLIIQNNRNLAGDILNFNVKNVLRESYLSIGSKNEINKVFRNK